MLDIYIYALLGILIWNSLLWLLSVFLHNASIADPFWGFGFVGVSIFYFLVGEGDMMRRILVLAMVLIWGMRLSVYLFRRNWGKGEDIRYRNFRKNYGEKNYWWISYFQTFLLQGIILWLVSAPLLAALSFASSNIFGILDLVGMLIWLLGFLFETIGDAQLYRFKKNPENKGKILNSGLWKYTRHPNYFGESLVWLGFGCMAIASGLIWPIVGSILMIFLLIRVSGVKMMDAVMIKKNPDYIRYMNSTSAFFPLKPKSSKT